MHSAIICEKRVYTNITKSHHHEHGQFLFPLSGSMDLKTMNQQINLTPEYCFYLAPNTKHMFHSVDKNEFLVLDIPERILPRNTSDMYEEMDNSWFAIRHLLLEETSNAKSNTVELGMLTNYVANKIKTNTPASIGYIHKNFRQRLTIEKLASIENYHPVYYSKWFKNQTGQSVQTYINGLRLKEAKQLLMKTDWKIIRISAELDFENTSSFTRWFAKNEGISPYTYRELKK